MQSSWDIAWNRGNGQQGDLHLRELEAQVHRLNRIRYTLEEEAEFVRIYLLTIAKLRMARRLRVLIPE